VPKAPTQRIIYEIYRDRAAFLTHERQPHIRQFAADSALCVLATNVIDLRLKYAKVAALGSAAESPLPPQAGRAPRMPEPAAGNDLYQAAGGQNPAAQQQTQYSTTQYSRAQQPGAASFTPAKDQNADIGQPTAGREAFQSPNSYSASNGYGGGYSPANGYQGASGSGYVNGNGYSAANGYPNANGYSAANGYPNGGSYQNGSGYGSNGTATQGPQYTPRYRELTSGEPGDGNASGYPDNGGRHADGRQPYPPQQTESPPRSQDQR
jgi:hypothetical protein